jgi:antitoxin (DNA-binding transcriptional repressor) of toxin-antitoxin stability system
MDKERSNLYNITNSNEGVIKLVPIAAPLTQVEKQGHSTGKSAMETRKKRGVCTIAGKRLAELSKEGK